MPLKDEETKELLISMTLSEFTEHFESFATFIEEAWEQKDLEILLAIIFDCEDFIHINGHQFKCYSQTAKEWKDEYRKNREKRREIANGTCEWCGRKKGTHCHHLIRRGRLVLYNDIRLLRILCSKCHQLFHS